MDLNHSNFNSRRPCFGVDMICQVCGRRFLVTTGYGEVLNPKRLSCPDCEGQVVPVNPRPAGALFTRRAAVLQAVQATIKWGPDFTAEVAAAVKVADEAPGWHAVACYRYVAPGTEDATREDGGAESGEDSAAVAVEGE